MLKNIPFQYLNKIYISMMIVCICITISFIVIESLIIIGGKQSEEYEDIDYLIVLGARLYGDIPSPSLKERLHTAAQYLKKHPHIKVIVSGGQGPGETTTEAFAMKKYLIEHGISENKIIEETMSTSTFENFKFSLEVIQKTDETSKVKMLIVTNKFHLFRSKFIARRLGIDAYGLGANTPPSTFIKSHIREYFAIIKSFLMDR